VLEKRQGILYRERRSVGVVLYVLELTQHALPVAHGFHAHGRHVGIPSTDLKAQFLGGLLSGLRVLRSVPQPVDQALVELGLERRVHRIDFHSMRSSLGPAAVGIKS
jgi:hypothetical protein